MFKFLLKALAQLSDPALRRVMYFGILGSVLVFGTLAMGLWYLFDTIPAESVPFLTTIRDWLGGSFEWVSGILFAGGIGVLTFLLFPGVVTIIVGIFLEDVVKAVEAKHYPNLPAGRDQPIREIVISTVKFACLVLLVNVLALPLYILLIFLPPLNLVLFYAINGYLTGREYFELVGLLRREPAETERLRKRHRGRVQLAGIMLVFLMTIPFVNLLAPVIATAFMVHFIHDLPADTE
ncbi:MAG TPA: hypothetical protein DCS82_03925 [Rhodospirillaceae bacterium]|nr:hypothetical protein [Rhodospirillaceae bacterium]HAA92850.1 hypothetical protein [Rhodospirillaceae bacterium]HAT34840.1 hypothetical protein [Rhodospirillaceae bacterium]|tara:strand:- start:80 stop:790 length:711 start_codon:yes stop_codon:yes gene_type:complete